MTENGGDTSGGVVDRRSQKGRRRRSLSELVAIVRSPADPTLTRAFAHDELDEAERYAREHGANVERLPD